MQNAHEALTSLSTSPGKLSVEQSPVPESWVEAIFTRLAAQLGAKVADLWGGVPPNAVKAEWADALAGYNAVEISRGLKACQTRAFAPTLGEFLRLCRPALDAEVAWSEAQVALQQRAQGETGEWTHPAVYRAAREFEHEIRAGTYRQHRKAWEWRLEKEFRSGWQEGVPEPRRAIAHQPTTRGPSPSERELMAKARNNRVSSSKSGEGHRTGKTTAPHGSFQPKESCG